jgi:O-antigen/teichoic acid export membrane protein
MVLKQKAIYGVKWTSLSTIIVTILQVLQISILARFLLPEDFGLIAIVMVVIGFSHIFSDMGITNAIIYHQEISHEQLSSLYWLNIFIAILLFTMMLILAPLISQFYAEPLLVELIVVLSLNFIILAFGNQHRVLLQKKLQFNTIAKVEISSTFISVATAIFLSIYDYGIYSLVYGTIVKAIVSSSLYMIIGIKEHKPSFLFKLKYIKPFLSFGMYRTAQSALNYFNSEFDVILIGKLLGVEALGFYSIMKQLAMRPLQLIGPVVTKVAFPILAKLQNDLLELKNAYLKIIYYITLITFPIYILITILAEPIVLIMFGEKWITSSVILQILAIFFLLKSTGSSIGSLIMATGKVHLEFWWNVGMFVIFPLTIYLGSFYGLKGVAISLVIMRLLAIIPMWYYMMQPVIHATLKEYFQSFYKAFIFTVVSALVAWVVTPESNDILKSLLYTTIMLCAYMYINYKLDKRVLNVLIGKNEI